MIGRTYILHFGLCSRKPTDILISKAICFRFFFTHPNDGSNSERGLSTEDREYVEARKLSNIICDNIQDGLRYKNKYEYFIPNIIYLLV